jgi:hypothetical protein
MTTTIISAAPCVTKCNSSFGGCKPMDDDSSVRARRNVGASGVSDSPKVHASWGAVDLADALAPGTFPKER